MDNRNTNGHQHAQDSERNDISDDVLELSLRQTIASIHEARAKGQPLIEDENCLSIANLPPQTLELLRADGIDIPPSLMTPLKQNPTSSSSFSYTSPGDTYDDNEMRSQSEHSPLLSASKVSTRYSGNGDAQSQPESPISETEPIPPVDVQSLTILAVVFISAILLLLFMISKLPHFTPEEATKIKLPRSLDDVRELSNVVLRYRDDHFALVLGLFALSYIFLQTFAIPGAVFLSILAGPLFGFWAGMGIVSAVATLGSSMCFLLSRAVSRNLVARYFPEMLRMFRERVEANRDGLFFYMLFLRISPLLPNWFISVSSPLIGVPLPIFAFATFFGIMPGNYLHITTGLTLSSMAGEGDGKKSMVDVKTLVGLFAIAFLALLPVIFKKRLEAYDRRRLENVQRDVVAE